MLDMPERSEVPPVELSDLSKNAALLHNILKLSNRLMAPFSTYLAHQHRISLNEFRVMMLIGHYGPLANHELVELTGVNVMSISRAVTLLQKRQRVSVMCDPTNRRRKKLMLTVEGERLFRAMRPATNLVADYLLCELKEHERATLAHILQTMIATLEARDEQGRSLFMEHTRPEQNEMP